LGVSSPIFAEAFAVFRRTISELDHLLIFAVVYADLAVSLLADPTLTVGGLLDHTGSMAADAVVEYLTHGQRGCIVYC
jgi:hypothetical protein